MVATPLLIVVLALTAAVSGSFVPENELWSRGRTKLGPIVIDSGKKMTENAIRKAGQTSQQSSDHVSHVAVAVAAGAGAVGAQEVHQYLTGNKGKGEIKTTEEKKDKRNLLWPRSGRIGRVAKQAAQAAQAAQQKTKPNMSKSEIFAGAGAAGATAYTVQKTMEQGKENLKKAEEESKDKRGMYDGELWSRSGVAQAAIHLGTEAVKVGAQNVVKKAPRIAKAIGTGVSGGAVEAAIQNTDPELREKLAKDPVGTVKKMVNGHKSRGLDNSFIVERDTNSLEQLIARSIVNMLFNDFE